MCICTTSSFDIRDFSGLYVLNHVPITPPIVLEKDNKKKTPLVWFPYFDSSFNLASYNNTVSNVHSVPALCQAKCFVFINLFIARGLYEICMIISPILLMSKLKLTRTMYFACGHMSSEHAKEQPLVPALSPLQDCF